MRIGIDISRLGVAARTGTEQYTYELLGALAQLDRRNEYILYTNGLPAALPSLGPNMALHNMPFPRLWTHARLSLELAQHSPDTLFVPAHVLPLWHPPYSVVTIHDLGYEHFPESHPPMHRRYLRLSTLWSALAATHLIAVSTVTRNDLVRSYRVPPEKISVVHHGVSSRFRPVDDRAAQAVAQACYGITPPYFLYVGTIQPRKNLVRLIEAFARIVNGGLTIGDRSDPDSPLPSVHRPLLVLGGKRGWLTEDIERRASELGVADRVRFTGYIADQDLPALLSGALAFVFPSLYEGFGMPVLEAMACGTPVLTSSTSSLPEIAGDAALLVDPTDTAALATALARLADDTALRADLQQRGLARAARFTWERCAQETLEVICKS